MGWIGFNCSIPHKVAVLDHLDELAESAAIIGAVNCVVVRDGRLIGENTDGQGFVASLRQVRDPAGQHVVVLGAGGAARAIAVETALAGALSVTVVNRTAERGHALADLVDTRTPLPAATCRGLPPCTSRMAPGCSSTPHRSASTPPPTRCRTWIRAVSLPEWSSPMSWRTRPAPGSSPPRPAGLHHARRPRHAREPGPDRHPAVDRPRGQRRGHARGARGGLRLLSPARPALSPDTMRDNPRA